MALLEEYEIKFHPYNGNEPDYLELKERYIALRDLKKSETGVMAKVIVHFFNGLVAIVDADMHFWDRKYREAFLAYQEAGRLLNNFIISRSVKQKLDIFASRLSHRTIGLKFLSEAFLQNDHIKKDQLLVSALNEFNEEISITNEKGDQMSSYAAFGRASFAQSQILLNRARQLTAEKSGKAKKNVLDAREAIRQSCFIDMRFNPYLEEINDELDRLTRKRLLDKAEKHADHATLEMEKTDFHSAASNYKAASLFYKRASLLAPDTSSRRMFLASATLYEASIKEAEASEAQKNVNTDQASENFKEAMGLVEKAIALLGHFGSDSLVKSFTCQRDYYKAIHTKSLAIKKFDLDDYRGAMDLFNEAKDIFSSAQNLAEQVGNVSVSNISQESISEINSYITMCENLL